MATDQLGDFTNDRDSDSKLSVAGESDLGLLRAYFGFQVYAGAFLAVLLPFARILPAGVVKVEGNPWVTLPLFAVSVWAAFRTRRLLVERHRDAGWMAGATLAGNLVTAGATGHWGFGALLSGIGVLLAVNVNRELRRIHAYRAPELPQ